MSRRPPTNPQICTTVRVARGAVSLGGARIVINLLTILGILVLARILAPADFGVVAIAAAALAIVLSVSELSLDAALVQRPEVTRAHIDTAWTMALLRALGIVALFTVAAWPLAGLYSDPRLVPVFIVTGITGAVMGLYNPLIDVATRDMRFGPLASFQILQKACGLLTAVALAILYKNFWAIIIGNAVGAVAASLASYFIIRYCPRLTLSRLGDIWSFSGWMFCSQLCETLNWRFDQVAIGLVAPKAELGHYSVADSLAAIPTREILMPIRAALFAGMAALNHDPDRLRNSYLRAQSAMAMITIPAGVGLALIAEPAVSVLLGSQWRSCVPFVTILALGYSLSMLNSAVQPLAMALGETKVLFTRKLIASFLKIPLILAGLLFGGLVGAAIGRVVSELLMCLISLILARSLLAIPVRQQLRSHALTFAGIAAMSVAVLFADAQLSSAAADPLRRLLVLTATAAMAYAGTVLSVWVARGRPDTVVADIVAIGRRLSGPAFAVMAKEPENGRKAPVRTSRRPSR